MQNRTLFAQQSHDRRAVVALLSFPSAQLESLIFQGFNPCQNIEIHLMDKSLNSFGAEPCTPVQDAAQDFAHSAHLDAQADVQPAHIVEAEIVEAGPRTGISHPAPYSSQELADELGVAESTVRTRWLPWIQKVAPVELLVDEGGHTELARSLLTEFSQIPSKKTAREQWVREAKQRYSQEFLPGGITPEGISEELGGALALLRHQGNAMQTAADAQLLELQALIEQQAMVEAEFDEAEVAAMRANGMKRGVVRFQIEAEAEDNAYYQLRKARSAARQQPPPPSQKPKEEPQP